LALGVSSRQIGVMAQERPQFVGALASLGASVATGIIPAAGGVLILDRDGQVFCAASIAGPTDRVAAHRARIEQLILQAGERISRILGYSGDYPPRGDDRSPAV
jgi:uncharacterized protein GlcG (DUF336 family)